MAHNIIEMASRVITLLITTLLACLGSHAEIIATNDVSPSTFVTDPYTSTDPIYVGNTFGGELEINNGSSVTNNSSSYIGFQENGSGLMLVYDIGTKWNTGFMHIGEYGRATFNVNNGNVTNSSGAFIARRLTSIVNIHITGPHATWSNASSLTISNAGDATMYITQGATVTNSSAGIASDFGSTGNVTVSDENSLWENSGGVIIGDAGNATLTIKDGGVVKSPNSTIALNHMGAGHVTVTGTDSRWINTGALNIASGEGRLDITSGGTVSNTYGYIGYNASANAIVTVAGVNSSWNNALNLYVANQGTGVATGQATLNIIGGGTVNVAGETILSENANIFINDGGNFNFGQMSMVDYGLINAVNGTLTGDVKIAGTHDLAALPVVDHATADVSNVSLLNLGQLHGSTNLRLGIKINSLVQLKSRLGRRRVFKDYKTPMQVKLPTRMEYLSLITILIISAAE